VSAFDGEKDTKKAKTHSKILTTEKLEYLCMTPGIGVVPPSIHQSADHEALMALTG